MLILCMWLLIINNVKITHQDEGHIKVKVKIIKKSPSQFYVTYQGQCEDQIEIKLKTRMHSSRTCTVHCSGCLRGECLPRGFAQGGGLSMGCLPRGCCPGESICLGEEGCLPRRGSVCQGVGVCLGDVHLPSCEQNHRQV